VWFSGSYVLTLPQQTIREVTPICTKQVESFSARLCALAALAALAVFDDENDMENVLFPSLYLTTSLSEASIAGIPLCCQQRPG
jgi:hypothetical protein